MQTQRFSDFVGSRPNLHLLLDPAEYGVSVAATFGYRARDIAPKPRRDASETVVWAQ